MKNRFSKITLLVLSLALIFGVAFALSVGAEETVKPEIVGKNISYTDKTAIQIAVDAATVDASDVELLVTKADGTEITVKNPEEKTIKGKNALVFTLEGIPASKICENVTIVVKSGDNESDAFTYSVAEYFYERLYSDGIINATEGKALSQKALYERYLSYGAAAQDLFLNYDDNGNRVAEPVTLVDKYNVIAINKGVLDNGNEVMISADSFSTTVTANAELAADKTFTGKWTVTTYGDTVTTQTVANGETVTANGIIAVTPVYTDATGDYFNSNVTGKRYDYDEGAALPQHQDGFDYATLTNVDGAVEFKKTGSGSGTGSTFRWTPGVAKTSNIYVFEADMKFSNITSTTIGWIRIAACDKYTSLSVNQSADNIIIYRSSVADGYVIKENEWHNIRIEVDFANNIIVLCLDNVAVHQWTGVSLSAAQGSQYARFSMDSSAKVGDTYYFDNVFCGFVDKLTDFPADK